MAIISCPECGKQISDQAAKCPQCGCPMREEVVESQKREPDITFISTPTQDVVKETKIVVQQKEGCFMQTLNAGCAIIGIIFLLIFLGAFKTCS